MATVFSLNGTPVARPASRLTLNRLSLSLDQPDAMEWTEHVAVLPGTWGHADAVTLTVDGTVRFSGVCVGSYPSGVGTRDIRIGYRALGLSWLANQVAVTASDGTGCLTYNLPSTDDDYIAANSGLSVGAILKKLFDLHSAPLTACGVTGYTLAELTALTVVPPEPVVISGRVWNAAQDVLSQWCNKYALWIAPDTGLIHVASQLALPTTTLTLDSDPIVLDSISRDHSECYSRVVVRGGANIEGAYLSLKEGTLKEGFTTQNKADWKLSDYYMPKGSADVGGVTAMASTTLTVRSDNASLTWAVNAWATLNAEVWAYDPASTAITFQEQRRITANTALTAGGTSILTVDPAYNNSGYSRYAIRGLYASAALTWRKYTIGPTYVAQHLVKRFHHGAAWSPVDGVTVQTTTPTSVICRSAGGTPPYIEFPATFDIIPYDGVVNGYIVFHEPTVKPFGTLANLEIGGGATDGIPSEIKVLVPYSLGAISATKPAASYEGTAYTVDGVTRVLYRDYPQWLDARDTTAYQILAQETLDTVKNTVVEGGVTYYGKLSSVLTMGRAFNLAHVSLTTGFESIAAPIRAVVLDYCPEGGPVSWVTRISFSNRLRPFSGDRLYVHPSFGSQANQWGGWTSQAAAWAPTQLAADRARTGLGDVSTGLESGAPEADPWTGGLPDDGRSGQNKPLDFFGPEAGKQRREAKRHEAALSRGDKALGRHAADSHEDGSSPESRALEAQDRERARLDAREGI